MRRSLLWGAVAVALCGAVGAGVPHASGSTDAAHTQWVMTDLGTLGGRGSTAYAINNRGWVVGTSKTASGQRSAFLWRQGRIIRVGTGTAYAVNDRGEVIFSHGGRMYRWKGGVTIRIPLLDGGILNERGQIAGSMLDRTGKRHRAALWQGGQVRNLGLLRGDLDSWASFLNDDGLVLGTSSNGNRSREFAWKDGRMRNLGACVSQAVNNRGAIVAVCAKSAVLWPTWNGARRTILNAHDRFHPATYGLNDQGQVLGSCDSDGAPANGYEHPCVWENGKVNDLGTLGGEAARGNAVNDRGQVVGISQRTSGYEHAFVWSDGVMTDLTPGGLRSEAVAINDRGQIIGWTGVRDAAGQVSHAVLWTPAS